MVLGAAGLLAVLAIITLTASHHAWAEALVHFEEQAERWHTAAPLALAVCSSLVIALWIVCLLPSTPIELLTAYLFGPGAGFAINYVGKVLGCLASFAIGRSCTRNQCATRLKNFKLIVAMERAVAREPLRLCFLARAAYVPIMIKNYGFAVLGVPWSAYVPALVIMELYTSFELVMLGSAARGIGHGEEGGGAAGGGGISPTWRTVSMGVAGVMLFVLGGYGAALTQRELQRLEVEAAEERSSGGGCPGASLLEVPSRPLCSSP